MLRRWLKLSFASTAILAAPNLDKRVPATSKNVIVQLFQWNWDSVAAECTNFLGPAGYGFVQVSPAQEHIQGPQWWTDYQPVSYIIDSKRGNRAQYQSMISTCHAAGVKVIADTIFNHMSGATSGTGIDGSTFTKYVYDGTYQSQDFHHCGTPNNEIEDYSNRTQVQTCELEGLADLATETEWVRERLSTHANDLLSLGVDGFRLDAAKWIATDDISNILSRLSTKAYYITQECDASGVVQPSEYVQNGDVQEFRYTTLVMNAFLSEGIAELSKVSDLGWLPSNNANVFVANHDTERGGTSLNYLSANNAYVLAHIFMLSWPYGTPTVTSGYTWGSTDDGAPNGNYGTCANGGGTNGWLCEHRWPAIAGLVAFRNEVFSSSVDSYVSDSSQQIAFGRSGLGFIVINNADAAWSRTFSTSLPDGEYCNYTAGAPSGGMCAGAWYVVSAGKFSTSVGPRSAIAIASI